MIELLTWIAARPRTYGETMDAWRTSCPRAPVWEDAVSNQFVQVESAETGGLNAARVRLTALGQTVLTAKASTKPDA